MARQRFAVADSDMHVIEPADLWINYIEPQFKARAPVGLTEVPRDGMDRDLAAAIARAYNDWLAQFCAEDPERLLGAAMLPPHDVDAAVAEARRMATEFGFKATFMRPNPINGRYWHHASYDPLWAELERLGVPICFHEGGSGEMPYIEQTGKRFDRGIMG